MIQPPVFWALMGRLHLQLKKNVLLEKERFCFSINAIHAGLKYLEINTDQIAKVGFYEQNVKK